MRYRETFIASPASDSLFLLGIPLVTLSGVVLLLHWNVLTLATFVGFTAIYTGAHHLPGFLRAYGTREIFAANRARLILAPLLIFSTVLFFEVRGLRAYIVVLWFFNWWHTALQNYGLLRIYERKAVEPVRFSAKLDLVSIVVWHFTASELLSDDMRYELARHLYDLNVVNPTHVSTILSVLLWAGIGLSIVLLVLYSQNAVRQFRANAVLALNKQLFLVVTYGVYLYMFRHFTEDISTSVESFYHNTQYVFFVWIMQRRLATRAADGNTFNRLGSVFSLRNNVTGALVYLGGVAGWGYLMGGSIKPRIHAEHIVPMFNTFYATAAFLHYYTDSFIWKARSRHISAALDLKGAGMELRPQSYWFSFAEICGWIVLPIVVTSALTNPNNRSHDGARENAGLAGFSAALLNDSARWPKVAVAANDVGDFYAASDHPNDAAGWYRRAIAAHPDYADAYQALGNLYSRQGDAEQAAEAYEKAVALDPSYKSSFNNLGNAYAELGNFEKSRAAYKHALELDSHFVEAELNLANLLYAHGDLAAAKVRYQRVLGSNPRSIEAVRSLAEVAAQEGQFDEADRMYGRAVQLAPEDKQSYLSLAKYQLSRGNFADANHSIDSAIVPNDAEPFIVKAQILLGMEKVPEAAAVLEQAAAAAPSDAGIQGNLGSLYLKMGRVEDAEKHLQEAVRLDPNFADAYAALAEIWEKRDPSVARMYRSRARR